MDSTLISAAALQRELGHPALRIIDCRFDLAAPAAGEDAYLAAHIPGAVYAHLETALSGPPLTDHGRHPLPSAEQLCDVFCTLGIDSDVDVVAYDALSGGLAAARVWWLLRYMGHRRVRVLDGGWQTWLAQDYATVSGREQAPRRVFSGIPNRERVVLLPEVSSVQLLVDSRDPRRFRGEVEPIDPRAGHIPGAKNHCWQHNLAANGEFLTPTDLREAIHTSLGTLPDAATVYYCGSGVSACHNVFAQVHAGLAEPRLYVGSWSEWCRGSERPAAVGNA